MDHIISKLLIYGSLPEDCILAQMGDICKNAREGTQSKDVLRARCFRQVKRLLNISTDYAFDKNLWHNYLTFRLITDENSFSLTSEKVGAGDGSVNYFAKKDFAAYKELFDYDFSWLEEDLDIDCFSRILNYKAIQKPELMYNKNVSEKVRTLSEKLEKAKDADEFFDAVTGFYKDYGVGMFGLNKAFRIIYDKDGVAQFQPINNMEVVSLDDLIGYEIQKKKLVDNTQAFVEGKVANNCLLYGDSGTGKSTCIKGIVNQFYPDGLRLIEIYKHQFKDLSSVIARIKNRNYKFIIYMDDLSFEDFEIEYKYLKAVIEGDMETKPRNVLIYATSNRRHLIKETWKDRTDVENDAGIHKSDTMEEKLSLANRFGCQISFMKPGHVEYNNIVLGLAHRADIHMTDDEILEGANRWELNHGGYSGRTAQQYINYLLGKN
ncbi:MAG: ATP-binding protein [Eubacteriales bacterium]|jgi:predicted AAA+ superfamily ATPase